MTSNIPNLNIHILANNFNSANDIISTFNLSVNLFRSTTIKSTLIIDEPKDEFVNSDEEPILNCVKVQDIDYFMAFCVFYAALESIAENRKWCLKI